MFILNFRYVANESELMEEIAQLYQEGKIVRLLEEIEAYANKRDSAGIPAERASFIIRCLARQWHSFQVDDTGLILGNSIKEFDITTLNGMIGRESLCMERCPFCRSEDIYYPELFMSIFICSWIIQVQYPREVLL